MDFRLGLSSNLRAISTSYFSSLVLLGFWSLVFGVQRLRLFVDVVKFVFEWAKPGGDVFLDGFRGEQVFEGGSHLITDPL